MNKHEHVKHPKRSYSYCSMHVVISPGDINSYGVNRPYLSLFARYGHS